MATQWQLTWNQKLYKTSNVKVGDTIYQSKGRARMKRIPKKNDTVIVVSGNEELFEGICISDFMESNLHKIDINNNGTIRKHADCSECIQIKILSKISNVYRKSNLRTWTIYKRLN